MNLNYYESVTYLELNLVADLIKLYEVRIQTHGKRCFMDIWILVIALLVIAIILLIASFFAGDDQDVTEQMNEYTVQQSEELYAIKTRLAELEKSQNTPYNETVVYNSTDEVYDDEPVESQEIEEVSDNQHEMIIRLYSQGYTMHEISQEVQLNSVTIQKVIDDYIENR